MRLVGRASARPLVYIPSARLALSLNFCIASDVDRFGRKEQTAQSSVFFDFFLQAFLSYAEAFGKAGKAKKTFRVATEKFLIEPRFVERNRGSAEYTLHGGLFDVFDYQTVDFAP